MGRRLADLVDDLLFAHPLGLHGVELLFEIGGVLPYVVETRFTRRVALLLERLLLDLELRQAPLNDVDFGRHAVDLHLDLRRGLVDEVDRLVREEPIRHVAIGERRCGDERSILDPDAVVDLVALLQPAEDGDRVLDGGLRDDHRLEAALQRRVLLDALLVLVEGGRADAAQLTARERRLEEIRRVHLALASAGADDRVDLVDEEDDRALAGLDLLEDGLQAILELATVLRASDERAHVERREPLVLERLGDVATHDALRDALDDGRLADARLADEHRVVLGAPREHLHDAADLLVATDDRIDLALANGGRQITTVLVERLELPLGIAIGDALGAAHAGERLEQAIGRDAARGLEGRGHLAIVLRERDDEVLDGHEVVLERL